MAYYDISHLYCFFFFFFFAFSFVEGNQYQEVPAVFAFGDSLIDVGNNNHLKLTLAKATFGHHGIDFAGKLATGRFSNGRNAADFFAEKLGLPTSPPYLSIRSISNKTKALLDGCGVNFASGGAGVFKETNNRFVRQSISFNEQIEYYSSIHQELVEQLGTVAVESYLAKSAFLISFGSNDLLVFFKRGSKLRARSSPEQFIDSMMLMLKGQLKQIYDLGARKLVVIGAGLIGCSPARRSKHETGGCDEEANYWAVKYNEGINSLLQELKTELKDFNYSFFSTYDIMVDFIQNPSLYGFSDVKSACCGLGTFNGQVPCLPISRYCENRRNYLFWDPYHPTEAAAQIVVDKLFNGPQKYVHPINVKQLLAL